MHRSGFKKIFSSASSSCALIFGLILIIAGERSVRAHECSTDALAAGTTFDLSPLESSTFYQVANKDVTFQNYSYVFNICGNTSMVPGAGPTGLGDGCLTTYEAGGTTDPMSGSAPAFQVSRRENLCWRLGNSDHNVEWSLLEAGDPSKGVVLTYKDGNVCSASHASVRRELKIAFECANDVMNVPDEEVIEETSNCVYEILVPSIYGCPQECGVKDRQLCNNKGVCGYDRTLQASRCFCVDGWTGNDCGSETSSSSASSGSDSATVGVLIFVCILLVGLTGGLVYMWLQIRSLRLDPQAYATLSGGGGAGGGASGKEEEL